MTSKKKKEEIGTKSLSELPVVKYTPKVRDLLSL